MSAKTAEPTVKVFERPARFGPKGQPFYLAKMSDGSTRMLPGLNPLERIEFERQYLDAGADKAEVEAMLAEMSRTPAAPTPDGEPQ